MNESIGMKHIKTYTNSNIIKLTKTQQSIETKTKLSVRSGSHAIRDLCAGQVAKNVLLDWPAESTGAHQDGEIANKWNIGIKHIEV